MGASLSFAKHGNLANVGRHALAAAASRTNHGQHSKGLQCSAGYEDLLRIRPQVGRVNQVAFGRGLSQIVRHHAFHDLVVLEPESHPQTLCARTCSEGLTGQGIRVGEVPDEVHTLDIAKLDTHHVSGRIEQLQLAFLNVVCRGHVAVNGIPVHLANNYLLVGGWHGELVIRSWSLVLDSYRWPWAGWQSLAAYLPHTTHT